jgi:hypothetical protein
VIAGDLNVHRSKLEDAVQRRGYVWVRDTSNGMRCDVADPESTCLKPLELSVVPCVMDKGHEGRCSSVTFYCDGCGKRRRGRPHRTAYDPDGVPDAHFCFMCVEVTR